MRALQLAFATGRLAMADHPDPGAPDRKSVV